MAESSKTLKTEWITLDVDGSAMEAYVAAPGEEGPFPGILVFMEVFGVNSHIRSVTERIAKEGYVAIAINYYHRTTENLELGYTADDMTIGRKHKDATERQNLQMDAGEAVAYLKSRPDVSPKEKFGCVGFCFGGHVAYIAASLPEIQVAASFYGGGIGEFSPGGGKPTVDYTHETKAELLMLYADKDPLIPHEETVTVEKALKEAGVKHEIIHYPEATHGFFCNQRGSYDAKVADNAWQKVKTLFGQLRPQ